MHRDYHSKTRLLVSCSDCKVVQHSCVGGTRPRTQLTVAQPMSRDPGGDMSTCALGKQRRSWKE